MSIHLQTFIQRKFSTVQQCAHCKHLCGALVAFKINVFFSTITVFGIVSGGASSRSGRAPEGLLYHACYISGPAKHHSGHRIAKIAQIGMPFTSIVTLGQWGIVYKQVIQQYVLQTLPTSAHINI